MRAWPPGCSTPPSRSAWPSGVAVLSTLAATRTEQLLAAGQGQANALTGGYHVAFAIAAALLVAAFTLALLLLRQPKQDAAAQPAAQLSPAA